MSNTLPIFMTVKLGTGLKTVHDFYQAFGPNQSIGEYAGELLAGATLKTSSEQTEVNVVVLTVAELGFKEEADYLDICQRGLDLGYELCPVELALQMRLQYTKQSDREVLRLAMELVRTRFDTSQGFGDGFVVARDGNSHYLGAGGYHQKQKLSNRFVFACRK